ncbi:hypothetical protein FHG87_010488 [Trinorchestia longiramus]|nr:hypothetical protein FHG87_010488 [Trinorchestia longiramus]
MSPKERVPSYCVAHYINFRPGKVLQGKRVFEFNQSLHTTDQSLHTRDQSLYTTDQSLHTRDQSLHTRNHSISLRRSRTVCGRRLLNEQTAERWTVWRAGC